MIIRVFCCRLCLQLNRGGARQHVSGNFPRKGEEEGFCPVFTRGKRRIAYTCTCQIRESVFFPSVGILPDKFCQIRQGGNWERRTENI